MKTDKKININGYKMAFQSYEKRKKIMNGTERFLHGTERFLHWTVRFHHRTVLSVSEVVRLRVRGIIIASKHFLISIH